MAFLTSYLLVDLLVTIATILLAIYFYFQWIYSYWTRRGVHQIWKPSIPMGHFQESSFKKHSSEVLQDIYNYDKDQPYSGIFIMQKPTFFLRDLDLIKTICVKDFSSFHDHGFIVDTRIDPLAGHLFFLNGKEWRNLRIKLTPTFTTGKMRMMFPTLFEVGKNLVEVIEKESPEVEVKEVVSRYTTDIISSVAFGIESNSLKNPEAEFRKYGQKMSEKNFWKIIADLVAFFLPAVAKLFRIRTIEKSVSDFFIQTVDEVMNYRIKNCIKRNDFMQLLLQLKTMGYIPDADNKNSEEIKNEGTFTTEQAAAQAFLFFFAGFETSSATMTFALYELALNLDLQTKVWEEIRKVKKKSKDGVTYDSLQEMELLDRVIAETLRKYPVGNALTRQCNITYEIPGHGLTLEKGTDVWISLSGIHHDPKYYPNPEKFDPDRFLPEEKEKRHPYAYLPFGEGPRNCIGNRFALMQVRAGLSIILENFQVLPCEKTQIPMVIDPASDIMQPKNGLYLKMSKR